MQRADYHAEYGKNYRKKVVRPSVTFSEEEFENITALAESLQLKPAVLIKRLTLFALKGEQIQSPEATQELRGISFLLRNIASNLNQIARHSNRVKRVIDENAIFDQIRALETTFKDFYKNTKR